MNCRRISISGIPGLLWGRDSEKVLIHVHGKMSRKEYAEDFAAIADEKDFQTLSFDLPGHGERACLPDRCDVWNGVRDLNLVADFAFARWPHVSLYACSLGAWFALNAYPGRKIERCLFQSPIVDMKWLVEQMMRSAGVTPERLESEGEIDTPLDTLRWDYYQYILAHPVQEWPFPTRILYAGWDDLQPEDVIRSFAEKHGAVLEISPDSRHPFLEKGDRPIVEKWIRAALG
jgi:pimeloyl-ACP methyl ester carboxylesterase